MAEEERTIEEQIDDLIDDGPVKEEVVDGIEESIQDQVDGEPDREVVDEGEREEEVAEAERAEDAEQEEPGEVKEDDGQVDEKEDSGEVEEVDEIAEFRDRMNKIAEAALRQGVKLPADLLGIEEEEAPPVQPTPAPIPSSIQQ